MDVKFFATAAERKSWNPALRLVFWTDEGDNWWIDIDPPPYEFDSPFWSELNRSSFEVARQFIFETALSHGVPPEWVTTLEPARNNRYEA